MNIKTLQEQIIDNAIPLSSALLYVKQMIESVGDDKDSQWLNMEINGYANDEQLPSYRHIYAPVKFKCESPIRKSQICSLEKLEYHDNPEIAKSFKKVNTLFLKEPLVVIEASWNDIKGTYGECDISDKQRELLEDWYREQLAPVAGSISRGWHEIPKSSIVRLFNDIKVKLLSILNYLSDNYPQLNDNTMIGNPNIVVSGNNNPINIINGHNNTINSTNIVSDEIIQKLKQAGVTEDEIGNLNEIIKSEPSRSESLKGKINSWLKNLSVAADIVTVSQLLSPILL